MIRGWAGPGTGHWRPGRSGAAENARRTAPLRLLALITGLAAACGPGDPGGGDMTGGGGEEDPSPWVQTAWALRLDTVPVPSSPDGLRVPGRAGAAGPGPGPGPGEADRPVVNADAPFRIRFELAWTEGGGVGAATGSRFQLEARRNGGSWERLLARDFPYPDEISTPRVSIVDAGTWAHGTDTGDLLEGSAAPFRGGSGVSLDSVTAPGSVEAGVEGPAQTEWEWPVVIRRYADGAVANREGDVFEFRMVDGSGRPALPRGRVDGGALEAGLVAVRLAIPPRLVGGTYVETPGAIGPWQSADGALYFPMEPAETFNVLMTVRSPDFGESWSEVGGDARPATDDLEGFATALHGGRIYMLHQVSEATFLHAFATTDAGPEADRWVIRDELVAEHSEPPTQVAALVADPDGRLTAFYGDSLGLRVRVRDASGRWGEERRMDGPPGTVSSGVMAVRLDDGRIHAAYTAGNATRRDVWFRTISPGGVPGDPVQVATGVGLTDDDIGALAPLVHLPGAGLTVVPYRLDDGFLYTRTVRPDGTLSPQARVPVGPVVQNGSDSEQVGADAVGWDGRVILAYIEEESRDLRVVEGRPGADGSVAWDAPRPLVDDVYAQWVRGRVIRDASGQPAYGIVYDAGSDGGSGMNRFVAYPLR